MPLAEPKPLEKFRKIPPNHSENLAAKNKKNTSKFWNSFDFYESSIRKIKTFCVISKAVKWITKPTRNDWKIKFDIFFLHVDD